VVDANNRNLLYFESSSMNALYKCMETWQNENNKRLLSISTQKDGDNFCCIALTNPSEVIIISGSGTNHGARVGHGYLQVENR